MPSRIVRALIRWLSLPVVFFLDLFIPKHSALWVFCQGYPFPFNSNQRALFEYVCQQEQVKAYVLRFPGLPPLDDVALDQQINAFSWQGLWLLLRSGVIVIHHGYGDTFWGRCFSRSRRQIVNLWHGIPVKGLGKHGGGAYSGQKQLTLIWHRSFFSFIICSSRLDRTVMSACFGLPFERILLSGLPRNDWLVSAPMLQTEYIQRAEQALHSCLSGRRLVLYAPTFRPQATGIYPFQPEEICRLEEILLPRGAVLGIRAHINRSEQAELLRSDAIEYLPMSLHPETQAVLKLTDILVTDYSSIWVDFLLLQRPVVCFMYDKEQFEQDDRPLLYDFETVFPGAQVTLFDDFCDVLIRMLDEGILISEQQRLRECAAIFHDPSCLGDACENVYQAIVNSHSKTNSLSV